MEKYELIGLANLGKLMENNFREILDKIMNEHDDILKRLADEFREASLDSERNAEIDLWDTLE